MTVDTSSPKYKEDKKPETQHLKELAIYLEGYKKGRNDLYPLGEIHLRTLWETITYLNRMP